AVAVADALKATKLMFITAQDGILVGDRVIRQMPVRDLESVLALQKMEVHPEMLSKAIHAVAACKAGVPRVHVISGLLEEGLLAEVFTNEGVGTLIYANEFHQIRRAMKKDIRSILNLTKPSVDSEELVKRTRSSIEKQLADYYIFEIDKNPVACVALHAYPEQKKAELAFLYVSPAHENQGIGRKLIQFAENKARELGLEMLIALSTQAFTYFQSKGGFVEGSPEDLPSARRDKYDQSGRNSKVLIKKLK
ncbi:MAG TPA: GNAT family N-acetyltransferase, partial [Patescibacteria group bacterium]|nr:GNAT family N-acetyltransferase [Patescibacteria group bacterium]